MARARIIKPGYFKNEVLAECHPLARILFAGLWTLADKEGRLEDRPRKIKTETLPYDEVDMDMLLNELASKKFIERYSVEENKYIQILKFVEHQNPHKNETESVIPKSEPLQKKRDKSRISRKHSGLNLNPDTYTLNPDTITPIPPEGDLVSVEDLFEKFWKDFPEGTAKGNKFKAEEKFKELLSKGVKIDDITAGASQYRIFCDAGNFNQHVITWLNQRGWRTNWLEQLARGPKQAGEASPSKPSGHSARSTIDDQIEAIKRRIGSGEGVSIPSDEIRPTGTGSGGGDPGFLLEVASPVRQEA